MKNNDIPRRIRLDKMTPIEVSIYNLVQEVEQIGADVRLTDAVVYLSKARESIADFIDDVPKKKELENYNLSNRKISENYNDMKFLLTIGDFKGAMSYWLARQEIDTEIDINRPLDAFIQYLSQKYFKQKDDVIEMSYSQLSTLISEDIFIAIPEILELNQIPGKNFYDLGALSRNVFYMICREQINKIKYENIKTTNRYL